MPRLKAIASRSTFVLIQSAKIVDNGEKHISCYNSNNFMEGSPFGGTNGEKPKFPKVRKRLR
jgi:hypothetical protein